MSALLKEYLKCRDKLTDVSQRIFDAHVDDGRLASAAALLGLDARRGGSGISESDRPCLYDFAMYDLRRGGRTAVESYVESLGGIDGAPGAMQRRLLGAMLAAKTSCYKVGAADPAAGTVALDDAIGGGGRATVHDRGMSISAPRGAGIFTRIVALPRISMTTGAAAVFGLRDLRRAVPAYRRLEKRSDRRPEIKRYALFFRLSRKYGSQAHYMDARTGRLDES